MKNKRLLRRVSLNCPAKQTVNNLNILCMFPSKNAFFFRRPNLMFFLLVFNSPFQFVAGSIKWGCFCCASHVCQGGVTCLNNKSLTALYYYYFQLLPFLLLYICRLPFLICRFKCLFFAFRAFFYYFNFAFSFQPIYTLLFFTTAAAPISQALPPSSFLTQIFHFQLKKGSLANTYEDPKYIYLGSLTQSVRKGGNQQSILFIFPGCETYPDLAKEDYHKPS